MGSPFGLPPAWAPGFALPDNVKDEGLERRGFVTKQMPRGTYDNSPADPTGGYAVPQYIRDEGYGQGALVTKWMPRGEYGPRVPQWIQRQPTVAAIQKRGDADVVTIQRRSFGGLGGLSGEPPLPEPFEQYGNRAARAILGRINQLAPSQRKQQLKRIMQAIDPSLWNRTADITRRYVGQGMHPRDAFPRGLARALAAGAAAEMVTMGKTRSAPQPRSLLGLGCDGGQAALGAFTGAQISTFAATQAGITPSQKSITIDGDLTFPYKDGATIRVTPTNGAITPARMKELIDKLRWYMTPAQLGVRPVDSVAPAGYCNDSQHQSHLDRLFGSMVGANEITCDALVSGGRPFYSVQPNDTKAPWAVVIGNISSSASSPGFDLKLRRWNDTKAMNFARAVKSVVVEIGSLVKDAVEELGDLACSLAQNPNAVQAGAAAGTASGVGAGAGAAGAAIAQKACGGPKYPTPQIPIPPPTNYLPYILIGGGALAAIAILGKKKKAP